MALNKNHEFEEVNGVKCGIVEKNVKPDRVAFLKEILEYNGYTVIVASTPPPKAVAPKPVVAKPAAPAGSTEASQTTEVENIVKDNLPKEEPFAEPPAPKSPDTFTIGVTDTTFNPINAIFGRMLKAKNGNFVTLAYWNQQEVVSDDEVPYFDKK